MEKELEGLNYDSLVLDQNVHKIVGTLTKLQGGKKAEVTIDEGAIWLVTGLGRLFENSPDPIIQSSLDDIIILSKKDLIEFLKQKNESR